MSSRIGVKKRPSAIDKKVAASKAFRAGVNARRAVAMVVPRGMHPRQAPAVFRATGSEIKAIDIAKASYNFKNVAAPPVINLLNGVATGAGFFNRVGSRIEGKSLHIRGNIVNILTSVEGYMRMIVIYDRQPNGALPALTDILQSRDQAGTAATTSVSEINLDQRDRFVVLRDKQWHVPSVTLAVGVQTNGPQYPGMDQEWDINEFIKLKGLTTHFKSSSAPTTIADINTGAIYMAFFTDATTDAYSAIVGIRYRYGDV